MDKRRWRARNIELDYVQMIHELNRELSLGEIADMIGAPVITIKSGSNEAREMPKQWDVAIRLVDLYLYSTGKTRLPFKYA